MNNIVPYSGGLQPKKELTPKQQESLEYFFDRVNSATDIKTTHIKALLAATDAEISKHITNPKEQELFLSALANTKIKKKVIKVLEAFAGSTALASTGTFLYSIKMFSTGSALFDFMLVCGASVGTLAISLVTGDKVVKKQTEELQDNLFAAKRGEKSLRIRNNEADIISESFQTLVFTERIISIIKKALLSNNGVGILHEYLNKEQTVLYIGQIVNSDKTLSEKQNLLSLTLLRDKEESDVEYADVFNDFQLDLLHEDFQAKKSIFGGFKRLRNKLR